MTSMRAVRLHGIPNQVQVDDIPVPEISQDGVLVRLKAATICANDWKEAFKGRHNMELPAILGHELGGVVEEVGPQNESYTPGDRVCIRFAGAIYCGHCFFCLRGRHNYCENWQFFDSPAGWVELMAFNKRLEERLLPIGDNVSFTAAALVEPLACSLWGLEKAAIPSGEDLVILGAGPMGLLCTMLAKLSAAARIIVVDTVPYRLEKARELGATDVIDFQETDPVEAVLELTQGRGAASVLECSGNTDAAVQSLQMTRRLGTTVLFSGLPKPALREIDLNHIHYSGINLTGVSGSTIRHAQKIINYLESGRLDADQIVTHHFAFDEAGDALDLAASRSRALKIALTPGE